jgi:hypothetical protein
LFCFIHVQALTLRKAVLSSPNLYVGIISGDTYGVRCRDPSSGDEVRQHTRIISFCPMPFYATSDPFTKTGSGQTTQGEQHSKESFLCVLLQEWSPLDLVHLEEEIAEKGLGGGEEEDEEEMMRAQYAERAKATRRVSSVHARLRAVLNAAQGNEGLMTKLLRREHCEAIVNWQSLWCPFTRRYYKTDVELVESYTDFLGFHPQNSPLFPPGQRPPPHLHGYLDSLAASMRCENKSSVCAILHT